MRYHGIDQNGKVVYGSRPNDVDVGAFVADRWVAGWEELLVDVDGEVVGRIHRADPGAGRQAEWGDSLLVDRGSCWRSSEFVDRGPAAAGSFEEYDPDSEWPGCAELATFPVLALAAVVIGLWGRAIDGIRGRVRR